MNTKVKSGNRVDGGDQVSCPRDEGFLQVVVPRSGGHIVSSARRLILSEIV